MWKQEEALLFTHSSLFSFLAFILSSRGNWSWGFWAVNKFLSPSVGCLKLGFVGLPSKLMPMYLLSSSPNSGCCFLWFLQFCAFEYICCSSHRVVSFRSSFKRVWCGSELVDSFWLLCFGIHQGIRANDPSGPTATTHQLSKARGTKSGHCYQTPNSDDRNTCLVTLCWPDYTVSELHCSLGLFHSSFLFPFHRYQTYTILRRPLYPCFFSFSVILHWRFF